MSDDTTDPRELIAEVGTYIVDGKATLAHEPKCLALAANVRSLEKLHRNLMATLAEGQTQNSASAN